MSGKEDMFNVPLSSDSDTGDSRHNGSDMLENEHKPYGNGTTTHSLDPDINPDEEEEKRRLINQVLELQNTLDDLSQRVDTVKEENLKLKSENQVLGQYIENLMAASSVFQSTSPKTKKK
jgi:small-conductance mechanosensitive channel